MTGRGAAAVVVGGGLAGITAALALADAGLRVTLLEGRPRLGGLAFSFRARRADRRQRPARLPALLHRLPLVPRPRRRQPPSRPCRNVSTCPSSTRDRRRGSAGCAAPRCPCRCTWRRASPATRTSRSPSAPAWGAPRSPSSGLDPADPALDGQDFGSWLARHGQSARAIEALWDLVGVATLNAVAGDASLGLAAMVFRTGLLSEPGAADIGWARVPLGDLHDTLARKALDAAGVRTELRTRVTCISRTDNGRLAASRFPARSIEADTVVLAVPQRETHDLLPDGALDDPDRLLDIGTAPILNVHVVYDRKVLQAGPSSPPRLPRAVGLRPHGRLRARRGGQYLALSQSAAQDEIDAPVAALRERYLPELERLLPAARGAEVRDFFVTRERTATFAPTPGVGRLRPGARTKAPGLYLAGAWTATGWPATMESAVRSGISAAGAALSALGRPRDHLFASRRPA